MTAMATCSQRVLGAPFAGRTQGLGMSQSKVLRPLLIKPVVHPAAVQHRIPFLARVRASSPQPGDWAQGQQAARGQEAQAQGHKGTGTGTGTGTESSTDVYGSVSVLGMQQSRGGVEMRPSTESLMEALRALREQFCVVWPGLVKVLPRLVVTAVIICSPWLLRPSTSLAHGAAHTAHFPSVDASAAVDQASQWSQCVRYGWTGLVAGGLHTLTGPDHLAALAPLTIGRSRVESAAIGALWGLGHDAGQILFGILFLLLKEKLHLDALRVWGSRVVALTLMGIGAMGIHEARMAESEGLGHHDHSHHHHHHHHSHSHDHSTESPMLPAMAGASASGAAATPVDTRKKSKASFSAATFVTGIVHGLQPDALLVVLPALAMPSRVAGASFLLMFLLGTVVAMGSYTAFIGSCSDALRDRVPGITKKLSWGAAFLALALGAGMMLGEVFGFSVL